MNIEMLTPTIGATVTAIDVSSADDDQVADVVAAVLEHKVLFFPDQELSPDSQLEFASRLGTIDVAPFGPKHVAHPELTVLDQEAPRGQGADAWHTDNTFVPTPPSFTILQAVQLPPLGGDTCFANMYAAYDDLSPAFRGLIDGLTATHDLSRTLARAIADGNSDADLGAMQEAWPPVHHPVVRTHPMTGRRALFVNGNFTTKIDGLNPGESAALLPMLLEHLTSPQFQCRYRWSPGTLTMWDNRCVQHYAVPDYTSRRIMHRVTVAGDEPR
jgi:taurine dioxygenase